MQGSVLRMACRVFGRGSAHRLEGPRVTGECRSEVKEEGRAQPDPEDMSAGTHPAALA